MVRDINNIIDHQDKPPGFAENRFIPALKGTELIQIHNL